MGSARDSAPTSWSVDALRIIVVDKDATHHEIIERTLAEHGHAVNRATSVADAAALLREGRTDLLIIDVGNPGADAFELMRDVRAKHPLTGVIVTTEHPSRSMAFESARLGALAYLEKPLEPEDLLDAVSSSGAAVSRRRLLAPGAPVRRHHGVAPQIIGESEAIIRVIEMIPALASTDLGVLIVGESGTGKELYARAIHHASERSRCPFVTVNCGAVSENLIESELFGHVRGAFTDAESDREGYFREAQGGTILLDEIGDMPLHMQVKLLRVLEDKRAPGGSRPRGAC